MTRILVMGTIITAALVAGCDRTTVEIDYCPSHNAAEPDTDKNSQQSESGNFPCCPLKNSACKCTKKYNYRLSKFSATDSAAAATAIATGCKTPYGYVASIPKEFQIEEKRVKLYPSAPSACTWHTSRLTASCATGNRISWSGSGGKRHPMYTGTRSLLGTFRLMIGTPVARGKSRTNHSNASPESALNRTWH